MSRVGGDGGWSICRLTLRFHLTEMIQALTKGLARWPSAPPEDSCLHLSSYYRSMMRLRLRLGERCESMSGHLRVLGLCPTGGFSCFGRCLMEVFKSD